jgi:hypothetical protein
MESRFASDLLNPGGWARYTLPGGAMETETGNGGKAAG